MLLLLLRLQSGERRKKGEGREDEGHDEIHGGGEDIPTIRSTVVPRLCKNSVSEKKKNG